MASEAKWKARLIRNLDKQKKNVYLVLTPMISNKKQFLWNYKVIKCVWAWSNLSLTLSGFIWFDHSPTVFDNLRMLKEWFLNFIVMFICSFLFFTSRILICHISWCSGLPGSGRGSEVTFHSPVKTCKREYT